MRLTARAGRALELTAGLVLTECVLLLIILLGVGAALLAFGIVFYGDGLDDIPWLVAGVAAVRAMLLNYPLVAALLAASIREEDGERDRLRKMMTANIAGFVALCATLVFVADLGAVQRMLGMRVISLEAMAVLCSMVPVVSMSPILVGWISNAWGSRIRRAFRLTILLMAADFFLLVMISMVLMVLETLPFMSIDWGDSRIFEPGGAGARIPRLALLAAYAAVLTTVVRLASPNYPVVMMLVALLDRGGWGGRMDAFRLAAVAVAGYVFSAGLGYALAPEFMEDVLPIALQTPWSSNFFYMALVVAAVSPFLVRRLGRRFTWLGGWSGLTGRTNGEP